MTAATAPGAPDLAPLPLSDGAAARATALSLGRHADSDTALGVLGHVARFAAATPDAPAVIDGDTTLTYPRLLTRAARFRAVLTAAGCGAGSVVAAVGDRSADTVAAFLAIEGLGAVYLPVAADWPEQRVTDVLERSAAGFLLDYSGDPGGGGPRGETAVKTAAGLGTTVVAAPGPDASGQEDAPVAPYTPDGRDQSLEPRYCIFTSGTTGRPKGAAVEHRGMVNHLWAKVADLELTAEDRLAFTAPLVFDISVWQMLAPLLVGGAVVVVRQQDLDFPRRVRTALERTGVTVVELVPTVVGWLVGEAERRGAVLPDLRWLISTGEELRPELAARALAALPHVRLLNAYGPTECSDDVTHHEVTAADTSRSRLPVGGPVAGARLYLLVHEEEQGLWRAAEPGEAGELFVGGIVVGLGYVNDPANNARAFFTDPLDPASPTGRLYRTGDVARFEDGVVLYLGRVDRQVKVAGVRMELDEIEAVLLRHPAVDRAAVTVPVIDGHPVLAAHYTVREPVTQEELRAHLAAALPEAMVPRRLFELDALPLTPNGKTDHRALRQLTQDGTSPAEV
ncbi:amino acid adenylation domain-containing protein [Streptomyces thermolilacinus]|uniref:Non-ribosomal peptide synthetase adenylation domain protein n=1 Tax=Streptomyces thermolilacinus SPC6 TaxID=1306406 RepID=A0A1D3DXZ7_9ACTN|nr:amino acid adenylation domain-containing protein [Streptomyces thermolilacinus]OEJ97199.1 non-ribosomal peptide synthetase adenylation domain protein [Streptomyces thermolilacinus SPC6]